MDKRTKDFIATTGSIALGFWIIKNIFDDKGYDSCPRCNNPVNKNEAICPNCNQRLRWD